MGEVVGQLLQVVAAQVAVVPQHGVVGGAGRALDALMGRASENHVIINSWYSIINM